MLERSSPIDLAALRSWQLRIIFFLTELEAQYVCPLVSKNSLKAARARAPVHGGLMMSPRPLSGFWSEEVPQAGPEGAGV